MAKSSSEDRFAVAVGQQVGCTEAGLGFDPRVELSYEELRDLLTNHEHRARKDGRYICRPMKGNGNRSDANADNWRLIPVDIDELHASELPLLVRWCQDSKLKGFLATTFSHKPDHPKLRLWFVASREISVDEHPFVHRALASRVPFKIDPVTAKPSQPLFTAACPTETAADAYSMEIAGDPLDVDALLGSYKSEMEEEQRRRAERAKGGAGTGVRQPGGLIDYFNQNFDLRPLLSKHGYKGRSHNRFIAPGSKSRRAAVVVYDHAVVSFHEPSHDPLAVRNKLGQPIVQDTFSAFCKLEHADDFKAAFGGALKWARAQGWTDATIPKQQQQQEPKPAPPPPLLYSISELYSNLKPQKMLVENLLDQRSVVVVAGDSNSGKTTVLQLLALQVALGAPFGANRCEKGKVLWIAGEDIENAKYRVVAMCEEYGIDPAIVGENLLLLPQPVAILQPDSMDAFKQGIEQRTGPNPEFSLIVVDSKSVNWGGEDENSNDENALFIATVRAKLVETYGAAVLLLHHLTKHKEKEARSSRGASALINNADHEWYFEMNQEARLSAMRPGSKVRIERWAEQRFLIKSVELPQARFPQLINNFGLMPRVSIAEPANQYNKSMRALQQDSDLRAVLSSLVKLVDAKQPHGLTHIADDLSWKDANNKADYRKVRRLLDIAAEQRLLDQDGKKFSPNKAARDYVATDVLNAAVGPTEQGAREPGED